MPKINLSVYINSLWAFSKSLPVCTKLFCFLALFISILDWIICLINGSFRASIFVLRPSGFIYEPWSLLTYSLREKNPLVLVGTLMCVGVSGKMFEPHWGRNEMAKFLLLVNFLSGITYCFVFIFLFHLLDFDGYLYSHAVLGLGSTVTAFSVCCKQAYPEYNVKVFGTFGFKLKQFPSILLASISLLGLLFSDFKDDVVICWSSAITSWVYLRFFKVQDSIRGDRSETFSFVSFFPTILRPPIKIFSNTVFSILVKLHCCQPIHSISTSDLESGNFYARIPASERQTSPITQDDAERRKALALKALDMRLKLAPPVDITASTSQPGNLSNPSSSTQIPDV